MSGGQGSTSASGTTSTSISGRSGAYSLVDRDVFNVISTASPYILSEAGTTLLSQISQVVTLDYRDSKVDPHSGFVVEAGTDFAGLGGDARFIRGNLNTAYYIPLERQFGESGLGPQAGGQRRLHDIAQRRP